MSTFVLPNFRASELPSFRTSELPCCRASEVPNFRTLVRSVVHELKLFEFELELKLGFEFELGFDFDFEFGFDFELVESSICTYTPCSVVIIPSEMLHVLHVMLLYC